MAFQSNDLSVLAYANGFTLWHYTSGDAASTITASQYFNKANDIIRSGDMVLLNANINSSSRSSHILILTKNKNAVTSTKFSGS